MSSGMIKGKHIRVPQWIEGRFAGGAFVVRVDADAVIPDADPSEPCFEPATLRWLDDLQRLADEGNIEELSKHGTVYVRQSA